MTRKSAKLGVYLTPNSDIGSFITWFNGPDTDMRVRVRRQWKPSEMINSWWMNSIAAIQDSRDSERKESISRYFYLSLIGCGPEQMGLARVLPPSDHSQVEVEYPPFTVSAGRLWDLFLVCLFVCLSISCMWRCSPGGVRLDRG
jgi:hypothetical protein